MFAEEPGGRRGPAYHLRCRMGADMLGTRGAACSPPQVPVFCRRKAHCGGSLSQIGSLRLPDTASARRGFHRWCEKMKRMQKVKAARKKSEGEKNCTPGG